MALPKDVYFQKRYDMAIEKGDTDKANYYKERLEGLKKASKASDYLKVNKADLIAFLNAQASKTHIHIMAIATHLGLPLSSLPALSVTSKAV